MPECKLPSPGSCAFTGISVSLGRSLGKDQWGGSSQSPWALQALSSHLPLAGRRTYWAM